MGEWHAHNFEQLCRVINSLHEHKITGTLNAVLVSMK